jgi:hypothetical protein
MPARTQSSRQYLSAEHAQTAAVDREWDQDNQQWWDWYMSLAANDADHQQPLIDVPEPGPYPRADRQQVQAELSAPCRLSPDQISSFQRDGYIKLKQVLSPSLLGLLRDELAEMFAAACGQLGHQFSSLEMMWQQNDVLRAFALSPRLARLAAELLGVTAVRLYHDNGLSKQPGCGRTPWHYDGHHFPIATRNVCTVWVPLQAIPRTMGPLAFARGMDVIDLLADIPFNKFDSSYDRQIIERLRQHRVEVDDSPFDLGEISFHHNLSFHTAGPNRTTTERMVLATTYFEDGARVIDSPHMVNGDWRRFMPGVEPDEVIDTPFNPVLYSAGDCQ